MWGKPVSKKSFHQSKPKGVVQPKMVWSRLSDGNCPSCGGPLHHNEEISMFISRCGFRISETKFKEITTNHAENDGQPRRFQAGGYKLSPEEKRQQELNNL